VHVYEMTPPLVATIIGALAENFEDFELWLANHGDMIVVAVPKGRVPRLDQSAFAYPALAAELARFNIRNLDDLLIHRIGGRSVIAPYYAAFGVPVNSDFAPVLDLNAAFARFLRQQVDDMPRLMEAPIPVLALLDRSPAQQADPRRFSPGAHSGLRRTALAKQAELAELYLRTGNGNVLETLPRSLAADLALIRGGLIDCRIDLPLATVRRALATVVGAVDAHLPRPRRKELFERLSTSKCASATSVRPWLSLHGAVATAEGAEIASAALRLLKGDLSPEGAPYVVAAHMTGLLLSGDRDGAMRSFQEHRRKLGVDQEIWDPVFRLLLGQASLK
jgi:spermidine synthase